MLKIIVSVVLAIVILKVVGIVANIVIQYMDYKVWKKRNTFFFEKSTYREAFIMECSKDMLKDNPEAKRLDKAIKRIDKEEKKLYRHREKIIKVLSEMK